MGITIGSFFSGIGGLCLGFSQKGSGSKWAVENDPAAVGTYRLNFPSTELIAKDIRKVRALDLEPVDILHAGFPCQSFSQAGHRKGFDDPRGKLFYEIFRIVNEFKDKKPSVVVLENSPYLRLGEGGKWFLEFSSIIKRARYWFRDTNCGILDPYELTYLPQQRQRLYAVAFSTSTFKNGKFDFPSTKNTSPKRLANFVDFSGSKDDRYYLSPDNRYYKMIKKEKADGDRLYQLRKYLVRRKDINVCPTLTANMGGGGHNVPFLWDSKGLRKLTEYECLKLQGFPDSLTAIGSAKKFLFPDSLSAGDRYRLVGNSVAVPLVELLAKRVFDKIHDEARNE